MSAADATRRRELQRRLYAPGGALTQEESVELQMLSAPAAVELASPQAAGGGEPGREDPSTASSALTSASAADAPELRTSEASGGSERQQDGKAHASTIDPTPTRWGLIAIVAVAALALGLGIGWLTVPRSERISVPEMTSAQQKSQQAIAKTGKVDPGSLEFAGTKHGAAVWTAAHGKEACLVLVLDGQRSIGCADPAKGMWGAGIIAVGAETTLDDGIRRSVSATMMKDLRGERVIGIDYWDTDPDDTSWEQQYPPEDRRLIGALKEAHLAGPNLMLVGRDDGVAVWAYYLDDKCVAVVDSDTLQVSKSCEPGDTSQAVQVRYGDATYSVKWTERGGATLTVFRDVAEKRI
ncbi:MAG TPA: hypothetical protein VN041_15515 [Microbacterium sp.]|nr:hypothetical protein [Microbacterium sp.]